MVRDSVIRMEVEGYIMGKNGQTIQNLGNAGFIESKFLSQSIMQSVRRLSFLSVLFVCMGY